MGKNQRGVNTKVEAAKGKKAALKASKAAAKAAADEAVESADWTKGSNTHAEKRRQEEERRRIERETKKSEKQKLLDLEENAVEEDKHAIRKQKKKMKEVVNPWEEALKPTTKKKNRGFKTPSSGTVKTRSEELTEDELEALKEKEAELAALREAEMDDIREAEVTALREAEAARMTLKSRKLGKKTIKFENNFQANRNREQEEPLEAHSLDAALDMLGVGGGKELERHPERRMKAAFKAFEETKMQQVKEDHPGLKLSQYKHKLREMWRHSPDNPLNQETLAYNAKTEY